MLARILLLLTFSMLMSCSSGRVDVGRVLLDLAPGVNTEPLEPMRGQLRQVLLDEAKQSDRISINNRGDTGAVVRVRVEKLETSADNSDVSVAVKVIVPGKSDADLRYGFQVVRAAASLDENVRRGFREALQQALDSNKNGAAQSAVAFLQNAEMIKAASTTQVIKAIDAAVDGRANGAAQVVMPLLKNRNGQIALAALNAIARLQDPSTLPALFDFAERKPVPLRLSVVALARQIGGRDAAAWLFVMTAHPDTQVQQAAIQALVDVEKRMGVTS